MTPMNRSTGNRRRETLRLEREHERGYVRLPVQPSEFGTDDQEDLWGGLDEAEAPHPASWNCASDSRRRSEHP